MGKEGQRGFFCAMLCMFMLHLKQFFDTSAKLEKSRDREERRALIKKQGMLRFKLLDDVCKLLCAFQFSKFTDYQFNDGFIGIVGMLSAFLTLKDLYKLKK